jgi:hypothetical protein
LENEDNLQFINIFDGLNDCYKDGTLTNKTFADRLGRDDENKKIYIECIKGSSKSK